MSDNLDPIELEFVMNSPELMKEFQSMTGVVKDFDHSVETARQTFNEASLEQLKNTKNLSEAVKSLNDTVGKTEFDNFGISKENIQIQKNAIADIETNLKSLNKEIEKIAPGKAKLGLIQEAKELEQELGAEKKALNEMETAVKSSKQAKVSLEAEYQKIINKMRELVVAGQRESAEYDTLKNSAVQYQQAINAVNQEVRNLSSPNSMSGLVEILGLVASGFSVGESATALFTGENENLERIMLRVQSLMAIVVAIQQIQVTLTNEQSAAVIFLTRVKTLWTATNTRLTASLVALGVAEGAATVAAQILIGTLTLGLSVAIAALFLWYDKLSTEQEEAAAAQKKMASAVADSASEMMVSYYKLKNQWNALANDLKAKEKFINGNQDAFHKLGIEVNDVHDAEKLLVDSTGTFIEAMMARAKAVASAQLAQEKFKEYIIEKANATDDLANPTNGQAISYWFQEKIQGKSIDKIIADKYADADELQKAGIDLLKQQDQYEKQYDDILKKMGLNKWLGKEDKTKKEKTKKPKKEAEIFSEGSVEKLQQQLTLIDNALKRMSDNGQVRLRALDKYGKEHATGEVSNLAAVIAQRIQVAEKLEEAEKKIKVKTLEETITEQEAKWKQYYENQRTFGKEAADKQFRELRASGMSYYEWLVEQEGLLTAIVKNGGQLTDKQKKNLDLLNTKIDELTGQKKEVQLFSEKTEQDLDKLPLLSQQIDYLIEKRDALNNSGVDQGQWSFLDGKIDDKKKEFSSMINQFTQGHQSYEEQRTLITEKYAKMREKIEKNADEGKKSNLLQELEREQNQELAAVNSAKYEREHLEDELGANLLFISTKALKNRISSLKEFLNTEIDLTKEQKEKLLSEVEKAENLLRTSEESRNERVLNERKADLLKQINSLKSKGNTLSVTENDLVAKLLNDLENVNGSLRDINLEKFQKISEWSSMLLGSFAELADSIGESNSGLKETLSLVAELSSDVGNVIGAFSKGLVNGIVSLVAVVIKWIGKLFTMGKAARESERKAQEEIKKYHDEIFQSQLNYNAELRKRISDEVKLNDLYKSRIDNIREEMEANKQNKAQIIKDQQDVFNRLLNAQTLVGMHTEKYGGFFGMGRKTRAVEEYKTIAELLGIGTYQQLPGLLGQGMQIFTPGQMELTDDIFAKLEKLNAEKPLTGDAKAAFEQLKKLRDEYGSIEDAQRELEKQLKDAVTGTTASALADSIKQGILSGKKQFADFADDIENFLRQGIIAGMSAKVIEPQIQKLQDELANFLGDGVLSEDEKKQFQEMYMKIATEAQQYLDLINQAGVNVTGSMNAANSLQGALRAASQESIDLLAGQTGGMRLAQLETNQILKSGAAQQLEASSKMIQIQMDIEKNTRKTAENTTKIHEVNSNGFGKVVEGQNKYYQALQAAGIIT